MIVCRWLNSPIFLGLVCLFLLACQPKTEEKKLNAPAIPKDEVVLSPNSPKRGYIQEAIVGLSVRPLLDPVTGTIVYDETRTVRVSSPISGRVTGSISAAVGFIALFGIAVQNGVILISQINQFRREGQSLHEAIVNGSVSRLRPVVMTALMAMLGLIPAAISTSVGSETAKPFAVVIIGGLISATLLTLTMLPAL